MEPIKWDRRSEKGIKRNEDHCQDDWEGAKYCNYVVNYSHLSPFNCACLMVAVAYGFFNGKSSIMPITCFCFQWISI